MGIRVVTTVTAAAANYLLTDLATVKAELGISGSANDAALRRYLKSSSAAAAQYCNRVFQAEAVTDAFYPEQDPYPFQVPGGVSALQLTRWPMVSVTTVTENGVALAQDSDFRIDAARGQLLRLDGNGALRGWPARPIVAAYTGGYQAIPDDIVDAVMRMVRARWFARDRDPYLMTEDITGVYSARWWIATGDQAGNMPPDVVDILDNYRMPVMA